MTNVLVAGTDQVMLVRDLKRQGLRATGISIDSMAAAVGIHQPDVIVLERSAETGAVILDICKQLRSWSDIPVVIVSSIDDSKFEEAVLDIGLIDYLITPFSISELVTRINAIQQRMRVTGTALYCTSDLYIDLSRRLVTLNDATIHLTRSEYKLLHALVAAQGHPVSYKKLLAAINTKTEEYTTIRQLIRRLRSKLNDSVDNPRYILTEPGVGYRLSTEPPIDPSPTSHLITTNK